MESLTRFGFRKHIFKSAWQSYLGLRSSVNSVQPETLADVKAKLPP